MKVRHLCPQFFKSGDMNGSVIHVCLVVLGVRLVLWVVTFRGLRSRLRYE